MVLGLNPQNMVEGLRFYPLPSVARDTSRYASDYNLVTSSGVLYGTLTDPMARGKVPVVFIIAGSGPTDRDGNSYGVTTNMYKLLADSLRKHGIASVRYDKRGVGASSQSLRTVVDLTFNDFVQDAAAFIGKLKADSSFSEVIVLGHSEGSLIGLLASLQAHPAAYISLAGAGESIDKVILRQLSAQDSTWKRYSPVVDSLQKGLMVTEPDNDNGLFRKSMQPYWISWIKYDPAKEISKLRIPTLILQGTTDLQVRVEDAQALKKGKPDATLALIDGMNHVLKLAPLERTSNLATYGDPNLPLAPALVQAIVSFIQGVK
jgi:pimeloyl-ACP methyl ester carboxylesterase